MIMKLLNSFLVLFSFAFFLQSCTSSQGEGKTTEEQTEQQEDVIKEGDEIDDFTDFKFRVLIANIPSPFEVITKIIFTDIKKTNVNLYSIDSYKKYFSESEQSVALGSLGANFTYTSLNNDKSTALNYLKAINQLSISLGIEKQYNQVADKYVENIENPSKKELLELSNELFAELDNYLVSASKEKIATGIIVGGWIESFYLSLPQIITEKENESNKDIYESVWEQKSHFKNLYALLAQYQSDEYLGKIYNCLSGVNSSINDMKVADREPKFMAKLYEQISKCRAEIYK